MLNCSVGTDRTSIGRCIYHIFLTETVFETISARFDDICIVRSMLMRTVVTRQELFWRRSCNLEMDTISATKHDALLR